jgi:Restriction endonuclease
VQDFGELSDYDFEQVVAELLGSEWRVRFEVFPRGRDGGVDLRVLGPTSEPLSLPPNAELVVQCKHMPGATIARLRSYLRTEARKNSVREAWRYILVTSARLTRANKKEIVAIFSGRLSEADVFGRDDIDALLRRHPEVVHANMKLWLASGTALQAFLNQVEHVRSEVSKAELERLRSRLVQTSVVTEAQRMLRRFGVCILAGAPGVGKTTTARILLLLYMAEGWRPVVAISDVRELEAQLLPGIRQILFFDDFLGVFALDSKLAKGDDATLVRLIHVIEGDADKVFILTTREYVLKQAQQTYEKLGDEAFSLMKLTIKVEELSTAERAHILYNQLYYSPLRRDAAAASDGPRRYMALTRHRNYNPRLVEAAIAAAVRDLGLRPERRALANAVGASASVAVEETNASSVRTPADRKVDVPALLEKALDNPAELWVHVLLYQLNQLQRDILITRLSLGAAPVRLADLQQAVAGFGDAAGRTATPLAVDSALAVLDGDLVTVTRDTAPAEQPVVSGLHPGVTDALVALLRDYPDYLDAVLASAFCFEQVIWLATLQGVTRSARPRRLQAIPDFWTALVACAERNLTASPIALDRGSRIRRSSAFKDFGRRLEVLAAIYTGAGKRSTAIFADQIVPQFLRSLPEIPNTELVRVLNSLRSDVFRMWQWRRTEINVKVLAELDHPDDAHEWSLLRDALDLVETTEVYREDLEERLEQFLYDATEYFRGLIDDAEDREDIDISYPLDELTRLDGLSDRWSMHSDAADLIEDIGEIQAKRDAKAADQRRRNRSQNQPAVMNNAEAAPRPSSTIFDQL